MGWYEDAKAIHPLLVGTIFVTSFAAGWAVPEILMKVNDQEKVRAGTYVSSKDLQSGYVKINEYEKILKDRNLLLNALNDSQKQIEQLKGEAAQIDIKKQTRIELEQLKSKTEAELAKQRVKLAAASQIETVYAKENIIPPVDYYNSIQRDIQSLENQLKAINSKLLEQF